MGKEGLNGWLSFLLNHPVLALSLGGALGTNARYWLAYWFRLQGWSADFPLGTFVINVSGSLILGEAYVLFLEHASPPRQEWFLLIGTGFCGGYTTFSTFELETLNLLREGKWPLALLNVGGSVVAGFIAVVVGFWLARLTLPPQELPPGP